jgi:hypothetical protein
MPMRGRAVGRCPGQITPSCCIPRSSRTVHCSAILPSRSRNIWASSTETGLFTGVSVTCCCTFVARRPIDHFQRPIIICRGPLKAPEIKGLRRARPRSRWR